MTFQIRPRWRVITLEDSVGIRTTETEAMGNVSDLLLGANLSGGLTY